MSVNPLCTWNDSLQEGKHTLNISHALGEDLLQHLGVLELLLHLGDDGLGQLLLLALLDLALVADPGVQDSLGLSGQGGLLLELVGLGLELGGFLEKGRWVLDLATASDSALNIGVPWKPRTSPW